MKVGIFFYMPRQATEILNRHFGIFEINENKLMPEISRFFWNNYKNVFWRSQPPHFHAIYQQDTAEYEITTLTAKRGSLPSRAHAMVLEWASLHRDELMEDWKLAT